MTCLLAFSVRVEQKEETCRQASRSYITYPGHPSSADRSDPTADVFIHMDSQGFHLLWRKPVFGWLPVEESIVLFDEHLLLSGGVSLQVAVENVQYVFIQRPHSTYCRFITVYN